MAIVKCKEYLVSLIQWQTYGFVHVRDNSKTLQELVKILFKVIKNRSFLFGKCRFCIIVSMPLHVCSHFKLLYHILFSYDKVFTFISWFQACWTKFIRHFLNRNLIVIICISYAKKIWTKGILHFKSHPFVAWKLTLHERKSNSGEIIRYSIFKQEFIDLPIHCGPCYWACAFMNFSSFWITW